MHDHADDQPTNESCKALRRAETACSKQAQVTAVPWSNRGTVRYREMHELRLVDAESKPGVPGVHAVM